MNEACAEVRSATLRRGLAHVQWPGRLQVVRPTPGQVVLLDGAHNTAGQPPQAARLRNWVFDKKLSGDIITEQNIHALDVATWIVDQAPVKAYGTCGRGGRKRSLPRPPHNPRQPPRPASQILEWNR